LIEIENFILNTFINFKPVKRFENRSGVSEFMSFNNGTSKGVLDLLETMYLRLGNIVVQRVTVVKFGMYYGGCNDTGCFGIKIRTDAAKLTNVRIARVRENRTPYFATNCHRWAVVYQYTNEITPNKKIGAWRGCGLVDLTLFC